MDGTLFIGKRMIKKTKNIIIEGISYNEYENSFSFDFVKDGEHDIVKLANNGLQKSKLYNNCFYYKYYFEKDVPSKIRGEFINYIKFHQGANDKDVNQFVIDAVDSLDTTIDLTDFKTILYPQSRSDINNKIISYIRMFGFPDFVPFELVKLPNKELSFDLEGYKRDVLDQTYERDRRVFPRYTEKQKQDEINKINSLVDNLRGKENFSIGKDVNVKYRKYFKNFYKFKNNNEKETFRKLKVSKILIVDDVVTSGATVAYLINTIQKINPKAEIVIFTIIGK